MHWQASEGERESLTPLSLNQCPVSNASEMDLPMSGLWSPEQEQFG